MARTLGCAPGTISDGKKDSKRTPSNRANGPGEAIQRYPSLVWVTSLMMLFGSPSSDCHVRNAQSELPGSIDAAEIESATRLLQSQAIPGRRPANGCMC